MRATVGKDTTAAKMAAAAVDDAVVISSEDSQDERISGTEGTAATTSRRSRPPITRSQGAPKGMGSMAFEKGHRRKGQENRERRRGMTAVFQCD